MPVFEPFIDSVDLSACVDASESAASLNERLAQSGGYWPLSLNAEQPLGELFLSTKGCSKSFRYGGLGDNVLGLAWRLPNGLRVDLGGRVVKNVAGFDLTRFLCGSQGRFGQPELLVLRLRPKPEAERMLAIHGTWQALRELARAIRASSWAHAIDALDLEADSDFPALIISFGGLPKHLKLFDAQVKQWVSVNDCAVSVLTQYPPRSTKPWARAQAPLDLLPKLAQEWLGRYGGKVSAFLGQGILNIESLGVGEAEGARGVQELQQRLSVLGGHVEHATLVADPNAPQARWEAELLKKLEAIA